MSGRSTMAEVMHRVLDARIADVHTAMPGRVESYDPATQTASVKPLIQRIVVDHDGNELVESLPVIPSVPVVFPRGGGGFFVSFPLAAGDVVLLVFCEKNIGQWHTLGGEQDPSDLTMHGLSGAVAIPGVYDGLRALPDAHATNMVVGKSGGAQIHITPAGIIELGGPTPGDWAALASLVLTELGKIINIYNAHTHVCAAPGAPSAPPVALMATASSVASAVVGVKP